MESNVERALTNLEIHVKHLNGLKGYKNFNIYIMGDLNINLIKCNEKYTRDYIDLMVSNMFLPAITEPTRVTNTSCTVIDHIWVNNPNIVTQAFVIEDLFITDHLMNGIAISTSVQNHT